MWFAEPSVMTPTTYAESTLSSAQVLKYTTETEKKLPGESYTEPINPSAGTDFLFERIIAHGPMPANDYLPSNLHNQTDVSGTIDNEVVLLSFLLPLPRLPF